jgi:predicted TIM-barrel fold metal-dependent hydrolase
MAVIDSDAHVVETERTWEFMEDFESSFKPEVVVPKAGGDREYWMVEGRTFAKNSNIGKDTPDEAREMSDIDSRLAHMDELGVDVHVLYPTIFLRPLTRRPDAEVALCKSYNRWLADIWRKGGGRLRWVVLPPVMSLDKAIEELNFGKENGACGVYMRSADGDRRLSDSYYAPMYQEAAKLDLPICVHASTGNFGMYDLFSQDSGFAQFKLPVVGAFHDLLMKGTPEKYPDLRWAFIEVSSQWIPYALNDLELRFRRIGKEWLGKDTLRENRMYVACQTSDDIAYVVDSVGDENIIIGTDYGHNDTSSELIALRKLREDGKIDPATVDKFLDRNAKTLYAL